MTDVQEHPLKLACVANQSATAAVLHEALVAYFPTAAVKRVDLEVERGIPEDVDCVVIDAASHGSSAVDVLRRLRARGFDGAAVLLVDSSGIDATAGDATVLRLGAHLGSLDPGVAESLAVAIAEALRAQRGSGEPATAEALKSVRQTQRLMAAGELAMRLQHSLNNPLAALLAEAQLLELEELPSEHRAAVERIIELTRRVIGVVRGLDGVGRS